MLPLLKKRILALYPSIVQEKHFLELKLKEQRGKIDAAGTPKSAGFGSEIHNQNPVDLSSILLTLITCEQQTAEKIDKLETILQRLEQIRDALPEPGRTYVTEKLFQGRTWGDLEQRHNRAKASIDREIEAALRDE